MPGSVPAATNDAVVIYIVAEADVTTDGVWTHESGGWTFT